MGPRAVGEFFERLGNTRLIEEDADHADKDARSTPVPLPPHERSRAGEQEGNPELHTGEGSQQPVQKRMGPLLVEEKKKMPVHLDRGRVVNL